MTTYIVAIDDLFRVEADSEEEAEQILLDNIGFGHYKAHNANVLEEEPE